MPNIAGSAVNPGSHDEKRLVVNMRFGWIFLVLIAIELWLLVKVGSAVGALTTVALLIGGGILGMAILRRQGASALMRFQQRMQSGESPALEMLDGMLLAMVGVLLMLPGFLSDIVAVLLLIPFLRKALIFFWLKNRMIARAATDKNSARRPNQPDVIEGEFRRED